MSNIFLKNNLDGIFDATSESSVALPQWITIVEKANETERTSSAAVQLGGKYSATSENSSAKDVNKLISMLTSESSSQKFNAASETTTASLENQLREILEKDGGGKKKKSKKQKGGDGELAVDEVKKFFMTLKSQGVNVDVKLNNKTMTEFFGGADGNATSTTTEIPVVAPVVAAPAPKPEDNKLISETSENKQVGGAKKGKKSSKKASKKSSKKSSKKGSKKMDGGVNPGFQAFLDLKKHVAEKLGISNGPQAAKVAGAVQKEMKEKHPELDAVKIAEEGRKHFDKNVDHYKQMLN